MAIQQEFGLIIVHLVSESLRVLEIMLNLNLTTAARDIRLAENGDF